VHSSTMRQETFDLVAILRATQQLSTETDLDRLRQNVGTVLKALTGATSIRLALWSEDAQDWLVGRDAGDSPAGDIPLEQAFEAGLLPASAFRYTQRTREPLVVDDALSDT